jgi:ribonuclease P protein component
MKRFPSIRKNSEFRKVYARGKSYANRLLVMYILPNELGETRIGISVSKKIGNSVTRHHLVRLVREAFRLNRDRIQEGIDIIIVARAAARDSDYHQIESAFMHLCGLHRIAVNQKPGDQG